VKLTHRDRKLTVSQGVSIVARVPQSKIAVPPLPAELIPRPGLLAHLDRAAPGQVVLVSAPAGYGKTLALADWVRHTGPATAWVTIDRDDDSPRLWSALLSALAALPSLPADSPLRRAGRFDTPVGPGDFVDHVVDAIETAGIPLRLVLDDVNLLAAGEPLRDLARLVHRRSTNLQLVLSTRVDPVVSAPKLRLEGQVHELRADHLRFSPDETHAMLRAAGLDLAPEQVARLHERTEGWAAGLRLAAITLRRTDDPARFIADFSGDERSMADYLTAELLSGLSPETLGFLRAVSVCAQMSPGLAVALTERQDAARVLEDLVRETALIERQVSDTYRIHPLLRTHLVAALERHRPALHRRLHATAARWWVDAGDPEHGLVHAERSGDEALLRALLRRSGVVLLLRGEFELLRGALELVRPEHQAADPWIALIAALTHLDERALAAVAAALGQARSAWPADPVPGLRILRSSVELLGRCVGLATDESARDDADLDVAAPELRALLHASRGTAEFAPGGGGDLERAQRDLQSALHLARTHGFAFLEVQVLCTVALLAASRCDHDRMVGAAEQAIQAASRQGRHPSAWTARASALLGYADLLGGKPSSARRWAASGLDTDHDRLPPETLYALRVVHGSAQADESDRPAGFGEIQGARAAGSGMLWPPPVPAALAGLEHRVALLHGNLAAAAEASTWLERRVGRVGEVALMEALAALAVGRPELARSAVDPVLEKSVPVLLPHTIVEALLVVAEVALRGEDVPAGTAALDRALQLAQPLGIVRPFVLAGPHTRNALGGRPAARGTGPFATRLAAARRAVLADAAAPLSERELMVLALLPSLLSAGEIADELTVSVNTVKSHIRSIYTKLGASSRRQAVHRAQERGLLL
jgi:LuxR family maltose regulon positive regulatory protein